MFLADREFETFSTGCFGLACEAMSYAWLWSELYIIKNYVQTNKVADSCITTIENTLKEYEVQDFMNIRLPSRKG